MNRCVVLRHKEDPWFLEVQREAVSRLYGCPLFVVGYTDCHDDHVDILMEYQNGKKGPWVPLLFETARKIIEMFPDGTLFLEGDMIPNAPIDLVPTIRHYHTQPWPGILYTGRSQIPTNTEWNPQNIFELTASFRGLQHIRTADNFDVIGENEEFLHPQSGCRGRSNIERIERFKNFVKRKQTELAT